MISNSNNNNNINKNHSDNHHKHFFDDAGAMDLADLRQDGNRGLLHASSTHSSQATLGW